MKPVNFDYARPLEIDAALALLADPSREVKVLAGGQSLGPMLSMRLVRPEMLVDITAIADLTLFEERADEIVIGACVTHADIEDLRVPDTTQGALPYVASAIAYRAVRNRGTVGGSLTHADPSADWITMLATLGAKVTLRGRSGSRVLAVEDYMLGALEADLRPGELLVSISVPRLGAAARWGYHKLCRKPGEFADALAAFVVDPEREVCRLAIGATETRPIVVADARAILGDGTAARFDAGAADRLMAVAGMTDALDRQLHVVALRRAIEAAR